MVMEYVPGGELFDFIVSNGRLSEPRARTMFQQLISGVEYCHQHAVVHRDLKPENLLLDSEQQLRIADFGLSNVMKDGDFFKTSCGSPNYAAPEVISGKLYAGPEVDVWSCGVILYALLCGSLPFDDENIPNLFKKIKGGIFTLPGHMSDEIKDLISRMLVVDPLQRITIPEIRRHRWFTETLPLYLSVTPDQIMSQIRTIDQDVLMEVVMKIGFDRQELLEALEKQVTAWRAPTPQPRSAAHPRLAPRPPQERNQMTVAYYLILDSKRRRLLTGSNMMHAAPNGEAPVAPPPVSQVAPLIQPHQLSENLALLAAADVQRGTPDARQRRWHLGIQRCAAGPGLPCHCLRRCTVCSDARADPPLPPASPRSSASPADMMLEIFRTLRALQFEWKIVAQYSLKCRPCTRAMPSADGMGMGQDASSLATRFKVKVGMQLYKIQEDSYLLDIRKVDGEVLPFMDVCSLLLSELKL
jgi:5'-AMP-activated protein kinase catalytic alpha subunit